MPRQILNIFTNGNLCHICYKLELMQLCTTCWITLNEHSYSTMVELCRKGKLKLKSIVAFYISNFYFLSPRVQVSGWRFEFDLCIYLVRFLNFFHKTNFGGIVKKFDTKFMVMLHLAPNQLYLHFGSSKKTALMLQIGTVLIYSKNANSTT